MAKDTKITVKPFFDGVMDALTKWFKKHKNTLWAAACAVALASSGPERVCWSIDGPQRWSKSSLY